MKRFILFNILTVLMLLTSCSNFAKVAEEVVNTPVTVNVEITTLGETYTVTPSDTIEDAPDVVTGGEYEVKVETTGSKISSVIQKGYFDERGYITQDEVYMCFTKLPEYECSYNANIPLDETFTVEIELSNGAIYYLTLTREWNEKDVLLMKS